ncbi:MAG: hypothetical protein MMC33_010481, partial [Icmadophila ericetorum]|nr:hypothetical protein [Icmadophila ericetorum]
MGGNGPSPVIALGMFKVNAKRTIDEVEKPVILEVRNARLVPDFGTSVVSESYLEGLGFVKAEGKMTRGKELICNIKRNHGLYFLEDNTSSPKATALVTQQCLTKTQDASSAVTLQVPPLATEMVPQPVLQPVSIETTTLVSHRRFEKPRRLVSASAQDWHIKMGHISPSVIAHLSQNVVGIADIQGTGPSTVKCQDCAISKATRIISRRPTEPPSE